MRLEFVIYFYEKDKMESKMLFYMDNFYVFCCCNFLNEYLLFKRKVLIIGISEYVVVYFICECWWKYLGGYSYL